MGGELSTEPWGPATRDCGRASGALPFRRDVVPADLVAEALDERLPTVGAARVFEAADSAGQVPRVDVAKPRTAADGDGSLQVVGTRVALIRHFVVSMERRDMPGDVGRNRGEK